MASRSLACAICAAATGLFAGCSSPFDQPDNSSRTRARSLPSGVSEAPRAPTRDDPGTPEHGVIAIAPDASPDEYIRYALAHSAEVEAAYQRWRAASERLPQVSALPDPRVTFGFFLDEVETRTGAQQARVGLQQSFPWPGQLRDRESAASKAAAAAWRRLESARLLVAERVIFALHDLAYLDGTIRITGDNLELLRSFEQVLRARYRVGAGSHPELIRAQVELAQLEDRLMQLRAMRPASVAELNAVMNRPLFSDVPEMGPLPGRVTSVDAEGLASIARNSNPALLALDELVEEQRHLMEVARKDGLPSLTVGLDYIVTDEASNRSIAESGDDPILLSLGIRVPL